MNKPRTFEVSVDVSVVDTSSQYDNKILAKFHLSEAVPTGIEPVDHLRALIKSNFARVFGPVASLTVENSEEVV